MSTVVTRFSLAPIVLAALAASAWCQNQPASPAAEEQAARIARLIDQLGASDFSLREKAQSELADLGLAAFDALSDAQHHEDIEIALRARFLVRSMQVKWHDDSDSPHVIQILRGYGELSELDRKSRIDLLRTHNREGVFALCRLARFEVSDELSKQAALNVMNQPAIEDAEARVAVARRIAAIVGTGKRSAAGWLRTYAKTLEDPESSLAEWDAHAKAEHDTLTQYPERTSREIVRDLYRFEVTLLQQSHRPERAVEVIRQSLALMEGTPEQLAEIVGWLIHREVWNVVEEVAGRFPQAFAESPKLQYLRAEAFLKQKNPGRADELARQALEASSDKLEDHRLAALELQKRGMFDWAEREFRSIMSRATAGSEEDLRARAALAEMLHDMGQELAAAQALQSFVDAIDKDMAARDRAAQIRDLEGVRSRLHYFYALDLLEKGDVEKATEQLDRGIQSDPKDADVLIALYRLPNQNEERRKQTINYITKATEEFRGEINKIKAIAEQELDEATKSRFSTYLAQSCNQLAWLVSNTTGDYDEALQCSLKSNELMHKYAAYLDTLGRCYFAKADFDNAIKYQMLALQEEPHSGQMKRQLAQFAKERDAKKATGEKPKPPQGDAKP
jgi:tetratricopeptide (TPR) repeat protein